MYFFDIFINYGRFCTFFKLSAKKKPHANPTIINEKIKEIRILTVGGVPGISHFKSHASPPCELQRAHWDEVDFRLTVVKRLNVILSFSC